MGGPESGECPVGAPEQDNSPVGEPEQGERPVDAGPGERPSHG